MKTYHVLFFLLLYSCSQKTTQEQRDKYEVCSKNISDSDGDYRDKFSHLDLNDSTLKIINDVHKLSLEELIYKYEIKSEKIDDFIKFICILNEAQQADEILNQRIQGDNLEEKQKAMDALVKSTFGSEKK